MIEKTTDSYKGHYKALILGPMLKLVEAVFDLLIPLFMKAIIDLSYNYINMKEPFTSMNPLIKGIANIIYSCGSWVKDPLINYALIGGLFILLMGVVGFLTTMVTQYIAAKTCVSIGKNIRDCLYEKILSLSNKDRDSIGKDRLQTVLNSDTYAVQTGILHFIRLIVRAPFIAIGALIFSLILDFKIGLIFLSIIPLILLVIFLVMTKASKRYTAIQGKLDNISQKSTESLLGSKEIRAFRKKEEENKSFEKRSQDYRDESIKVSKLNSLINPLTFAIIAFATVLVTLIPAFNKSVALDSYTSSTLITEVAYLAQIFTTLVQLTNVITILTKARVSAKRIDEVLKVVPSIKNGTELVDRNSLKEDLLIFDHVSLGYEREGNLALKDISFSLKRGKSLGIIGATGSGKSSLLKLIVRFFDTTSGTIYYKGRDIKDYDIKSLRDDISFVLQRSNLFIGTIRSNMLLSNEKASDEDITKALKDSQSYEFVSKYDDYLDHKVEEGGNNFSGGQKQRLAIARGLVKDASLLILDDSTSALDLLTDKRVRESVQKRVDLTKIIVSQRVATVSGCDEILLIDEGKIIARGSNEELLSTSSIYKEIYDSQMKKEEI